MHQEQQRAVEELHALLRNVADAEREDYAQWVEVCEREYLELRRRAKKGQKSFLNKYGATHEAEFFAVITEEFFNDPKDMKKNSPALYGVLKDYYRQDPVGRE